MKGKWQYLLVAGVFLIWIMACGLPFTVTAVNAPTATPQIALTALKALETLLTPPPPTPTATETPLPTATLIPTITATVTGTNTTVPTATSTAAPVVPYNYGYNNYGYEGGNYYTRPAGSFWATHMWSMPAIDGSWDSIGGTAYSASYLIYGSGSFNGSSDLSSSFRLGWDSNYLYVAAKVVDDNYCQNASGGDIYMGDSIEILLDADINSDYYTTTLNSDDYQLAISPGKGGIGGSKEAVMYFPRSGNGSRDNLIIGSSGFSGGYRVSAATVSYTHLRRRRCDARLHLARSK